MSQRYILFVDRGVTSKGRPNGASYFGITREEHYYELEELGITPGCPSESDIGELARRISVTDWGRMNIIPNKNNLLTIGDERLMDNPAGERCMVSPVSGEQIDMFWDAYVEANGL